MSTVYSRLENILNGRLRRTIATATVVSRRVGRAVVRYHATDVVVAGSGGTVTLNSGGWRTATTKRRINAFLPEGWHLYQHRHEWFLRAPDGREVPFADGITLLPDGTAVVRTLAALLAESL